MVFPLNQAQSSFSLEVEKNIVSIENNTDDEKWKWNFPNNSKENQEWEKTVDEYFNFFNASSSISAEENLMECSRKETSLSPDV